jgi:hypothetical protein
MGRALNRLAHSVTCLITFACYGCHLHGDAAGSVDRAHNVPGSRILEEDAARATFEEQRMDQPPHHLDHIRRDAVLEAIQASVRIVAGICWWAMYEAIKCIPWSRRRVRRSES